MAFSQKVSLPRCLWHQVTSTCLYARQRNHGNCGSCQPEPKVTPISWVGVWFLWQVASKRIFQFTLQSPIVTFTTPLSQWQTWTLITYSFLSLKSKSSNLTLVFQVQGFCVPASLAARKEQCGYMRIIELSFHSSLKSLTLPEDMSFLFLLCFLQLPFGSF